MTLRVSMSSTAFKQVPPLVNFQGGLNMEPLSLRKDKVIFVVGASGTGKSRLSIDLATRYPAEVVKCDKLQVYKGLDVGTYNDNPEQSRSVPQNLVAIIEPNTDFTSDDFRQHASTVVESIAKRDRLPIIAGGSNSYIEALENDEDDREFRLRHQFRFLWVDVSLAGPLSFLRERVNRMIDKVIDTRTRANLVNFAISKIKVYTCMVARRLLRTIRLLHSEWEWYMHRSNPLMREIILIIVVFILCN